MIKKMATAETMSETARRKHCISYARKVGVALPLTPQWFGKYDRAGQPTRAGDRNESKKVSANVVPKELNILLLGETGVGKSTFINALINYVTYSTLAEAEKGEQVCLIPAKFTLMDDDYNEQTITYGDDKNELFDPGQSATQMPRTYSFKEGNLVLNIIDTPGIGDTRGVDQDKKNVQYILQHIANYEHLHGICILMKPNNARLTVMFRFCIQELLRQLHRDACKNMLICFTHTRCTLYRPGDTLTALRQLLKEDKTDISLTTDNIFCLDNEAVKCLIAGKKGIKFEQEERSNYEQSWNKSVQETVRLIDRVASLEPHQVKYTVTLNEVRSSILALCRPIAETCKALQMNIVVSKEKACYIKIVTDKRGIGVSELYTPVIELVATALNHPQVVCTSEKCIKKTGGANKVFRQDVPAIDYGTICCSNCDIEIDKNQIGSTALQHCSAMQPSRTACTKCGCPWNVHMQITFNVQYETSSLVDDQLKQMFTDKKDKDGASKATQQQLKMLDARIRLLENDLDQMIKACARFAGFLKQSLIIGFQDAILAYLIHMINSERAMCDDGGMPQRVEALKTMRQRYLTELANVDGASKSADGDIQLDGAGIHQLIISLQALKMAGPILMTMMHVTQTAEDEPREIQVTRIKDGFLKKLFKKVSDLLGLS